MSESSFDIKHFTAQNYATDYSRDGKCRIPGFFEDASALALTKIASEDRQFRQAYSLNGKYFEVSAEEFRQLSAEQRQELIHAVYSGAAHGEGFWYGRQGLNENMAGAEKSLFEWLNSESVLKLVRSITGENKIRSATAQITAMRAGDFLTRHRDDIGPHGRKVAFVINLTPDWHPDWGGILQFFDQPGNPTESWSPMYNSLCLFDVQEIHSVTCVAPFAPRARLAISGWFQES